MTTMLQSGAREVRLATGPRRQRERRGSPNLTWPLLWVSITGQVAVAPMHFAHSHIEWALSTFLGLMFPTYVAVRRSRQQARRRSHSSA